MTLVAPRLLRAPMAAGLAMAAPMRAAFAMAAPMRAAFAMAAAALGLVVLFSGAAQASTAAYAPDGSPSLSTSSPAPGEALAVSGDGFRSGSLVRVVIFSEPVVLGTARADAAGQVALNVKIPSSFAPGSDHRVELQGVDSSGEVRILSREITLAGGTGNTLASTGAVLLPIVGLGAVLLVAGGALVFSGRNRRTAR